MPLITPTELIDDLLTVAAQDPPVPRPAPRPMVASETLAARRSARQFADREVPLDLLAQALGPRGADTAVALSSGLYLWADRGLGRRIGDAALTKRLHERYVVAPVLLLRVATPADVRDYYRLLLEAGMAWYDTWLAALDTGLAACPFGGANGEVVQALADAGRPADCHLFTLALGWPA